MRFDRRDQPAVRPEQLSPKARELYEASVERVGEEQSRIWLEYRDHYILDDDMNVVPAAFAEWAIMYEAVEERWIRRDEIGTWLISTVFLGLDHGFDLDRSPNYQPLVFETMIFNHGKKTPSREWLDQRCWRYRTTQEAVAGHNHAVEVVRRYLKMPRRLKKALGQDDDTLTPRQRELVGAYVRTLA